MTASASERKPKYTELSDSQFKWPHMVYQWLCIKILYFYHSLNHKITIVGKENQPKGWQSYIVACNHTSSKDPPLVSIALDYQPVSYMAKVELFEQPLLRLYNWGMSSFAVNRDKLELSTIKTALKVLKTNQWALGIFPEGTRTQTGDVSNPKRGVAYFAKAAQVPVLPMAIVHSTRNGKKRIDIHIGKLIPPSNDLEALSAQIQQAIQEQVQAASTAP